MDGKYLQRYFDEIAYRFNRRYMEGELELPPLQAVSGGGGFGVCFVLRVAN